MPLDGLTLKRRFRRFLGSSVEFDLAPYMARHARIDRLATEVAATDDAGLTAWARRLKTRVGEGVSLDQVLDELFALAREASERVLGTSCIPSFCQHQITPKTSRYTRCSMSMLPNVSINGRIRSSGQLGRWWYSISPCRNNECVRRFTVFAFNQRS